MDTSNIIIGCGAVGKRIAAKLLQQNQSVSALSHQPASQAALRQMGIQVFPADLDASATLSTINFQNSHIYYLAPPPTSSNEDSRMRNFIAAIAQNKPPNRIVYISTTGVYGDADGEWVNETTLPAPQASRGKRRLDAEQQLTHYCQRYNTEYNILRVSGIYCLSKLPLERLKAGIVAIELASAPSSNRVHADDLATICIAAMNSPVTNNVFNVADGNPTSITDYFIQVATVFGLPQPQQISAQQAQSQLSEGMLSYLAESKKIAIDKLKNVLGVTLQYPDLTSGLKQCLEESKSTSRIK